MGIFDDARAIIFVADHLAIDAGGKITALGLGFGIAGVQPNGLIAPQHVGVMIDVPSKYAGQDFALTIELRDESTGHTVEVPGPSGKIEALRVQQLLKVQPVNVPGLYLPESVPARVQTSLAFPMGLPLQPGKSYKWWLEIDAQHRAGWEAAFHVAGPPPPPVFGGPAGPAHVPGLNPQQ